MIRLISKKCYQMSIFRSILVNDPDSFDRMVTNIPVDGLKQTVSPLLGIPYLSKYESNQEELKTKSKKYYGKIIGDRSRLFFSIPTAIIGSKQYYYVHYLLATGSPHTTLTRQAFSCLFGNDQSDKFAYGAQCVIEGRTIMARLSNPSTDEKQSNSQYRNANVLGQDFLRRFKTIKLEQNFSQEKAVLELIDN